MSAKWLQVLNAAESVDMVISGPIGKSWWDDSGTSSKEFRDELKAIPKGRKINVRINSEGGSIKDGLEIYNALNERRADVTCHVDGYAVSIASIIALAGSKTVSPKSSIWMIHEPWSMTQGNAEDHKRSADMLNTHGDMLASIYAQETGKSKTAMRDAMKAETWFTGEEAQAFGLADESPDDTTTLAAFDPTIAANFRNVPRHILAALSKGAHTENGNRPVTDPAASLSAPLLGAGNQPPKKETMKETVIAELNKRGIKFAADATDEQLLALLNKKEDGSKLPNLDNRDSSEEIKRLQNQIHAEKRARISGLVRSAGENRIANDSLDFWIELAMNDETKVLAQIAKLPAQTPGGEPLGHVVELSAKNPLEAIKAEHKTALSRKQAMAADWSELFADAGRRDKRDRKEVLAANTYSATLVTSFLTDGAITNLQNMWAPLNCFSLDSSADAFKPLATAIISNVTAGGATQTDATNFESGNSTVAPVSVTMHQYSNSFNVSNTDLQNGLRMDKLVTINSANFANKIIEVATVPLTTVLFTATPLTSASGAFGWSDMATLWGQLKKSPIKNIMLDGEYLANLVNTPGNFQATGTGDGTWANRFGWNQIALNTDWTGAGANVRGFACNPQAVGGVTGLPAEHPNIPGGVFSMGSSIVPGINVSFAVHTWFALSSRTMWCSYDIMGGFKEVDVTAGVIIKSA